MSNCNRDLKKEVGLQLMAKWNSVPGTGVSGGVGKSVE